MHGLNEPFDLLDRVVEVERSPDGGPDAEALKQGHRTMVPGSNGDALCIQEVGDVLSVQIRVSERADARA